MDIFGVAALLGDGVISRTEALERVTALPPLEGPARPALDVVLLSSDPAAALDFLVAVGALDVVLPEVSALKMEQCTGRARHKDNYVHTLKVVSQAVGLEDVGVPDLTLRMAALLHDVGKPATRAYSGSQVTFHGHDLVGARMVRERLLGLGYDLSFVEDVCSLVELHLRTFGYRPGRWTDSGVRRYMTDAGDLLVRLNRLVRADVTTGNPAQARKLSSAIDDLEERISLVQAADRAAALRPDLDGTTVMEVLGLTPGREVGEAMRFLLDLKREGVTMSQDEAVMVLREWWSARA